MPNAIKSHCVIHRKALAFKTLPDAMKYTLTVIIQAVNFLKAKTVIMKLLINQCEYMDSNHESAVLLLFGNYQKAIC